MSTIPAPGPGWKKAILVAALLVLATGSGRADSSNHLRVTVGFGAYFGGPAFYGYGGYYYPAQYPPGYQVPAQPYYAFVDTDIHPEDARVYLDGRVIGIADDFDGYPGYLALKPGRHVLVFQFEGFHALSFKLKLHAGEMVDLDQKLARLAAGEKEEAPPVPPAEPRTDQESTPPAEEGREAGRGSYGTLKLTVLPPEARVLLDGDFFGTGAEISRLHTGIPLAAGTHRIRVNLAGYRAAALETEIRESEERTLQISLKKQ